MRQTAVDWLYNNLKSHFEHDGDLLECVQMSMQQAKEMEKEQVRTILLAYNEEINDRTDGAQNYWEPYEVDDFLEKHNETFKTNEK